MQAIERVDSQPIAKTDGVANLIQIALSNGQNPTELYAILREEREQQARMAYNRAFCEFKRVCPEIPKNATGVGGGGARYSYAELEDIQRTVDPILTRLGLSYSFDPTTTPEASTIRFILRHTEGYSEAFGPYGMPNESKAGMSAQQKVGSATSFAMRNSLKAALGLRVGDPDPDGATMGDAGGEVLSDQQQLELDDLIQRSGADTAKLWKWAGCSGLDTFPIHKLAEAKRILGDKIAGKK